MRELYVVAVSEDGRHAVLATSKDAARGGFRVALDNRLKQALKGELPGSGPRVALTPKEIQHRLRAGETAEQIALYAGVPVARIERFSGPVEGERLQTVDAARSAHLVRGRRGASALPLGEAVDLALAALGVDGAWTARREQEGDWVVEVSWTARGRVRRGSWTYDPSARTVRALDPASVALGHADEAPPVAPSRRAITTANSATTSTSTSTSTSVRRPRAASPRAEKPAAEPAGKRTGKVTASPGRAAAPKAMPNAPSKTSSRTPSRTSSKTPSKTPSKTLSRTSPAAPREATSTKATRKVAPSKAAPQKAAAQKAAPQKAAATTAARATAPARSARAGAAPVTAAPRPAGKKTVSTSATPGARLRVVPDPAPATTRRARSAAPEQRAGVRRRATVPVWADVLLGTATADQDGER